jgi:hypothetical protein
MGFKSLIARQVQGAMRILGNDSDGLAERHTFVNLDPEGSVYDPVTRTVTDDVNEVVGVPMLLVRFKIEDMAPEVRPKTDRKALIASLDLPPGVTPREEDRIKLSSGAIYTVVRVMSDPSDGLVILHIRYMEEEP